MKKALLEAMAWLAGSLAAVTAVLYGAGFIAVQARLALLGVTRLVDVPPTDYLTEGGLFFAQLPLFLMAGLLLSSPFLLVGRLLRRHLPRTPGAVALTFLTASATVFASIAFLLPSPAILMRAPSAPGHIDSLLRQGAEGHRYLLSIYSAVVAAVAALSLLAVRSWPLLDRQRPITAPVNVARIGGLGLTLLCVLLVPATFGVLARPVRFPYVTVQGSKDAKFDTVDGFLLSRWSGADSSLVLYLRGGGVFVAPSGSIESIRCLDDAYLFGPTGEGGAK